MGAWGTGIFADDDAADIRENFKHYIASCQDVAAATDAAAMDYGASLDNPGANSSFWIALALVQWRAGWLDERAVKAALSVIEEGSDLAKWAAGDQSKRRQVLLKAREKLLKPAPAPSPFGRAWPVCFADWELGEIVGRWLPNGRLAVLKVARFKRWTSLRLQGPVVVLQYWMKNEMPSAHEAAELQTIRYPVGFGQCFGGLILTPPPEVKLTDADFIRPGIRVPVHKLEGVGWGLPWKKPSNFSKEPTNSIFNREYDLDQLLTRGLERFWADPSLGPTALYPWHPSMKAPRTNAS